MGVVIESVVWEPNPAIYIFFFCSCFLSIFLLPYFSSDSSGRPSAPLEHGLSPSLLRFRRAFLLLYSLASVLEGFWSVFGESENGGGARREEMAANLCVGYFAASVFSTLFGILTDLIGQKKVCLIFWILHLFISMCKTLTVHSNTWMGGISLSLATSIFTVSFETWMVVEHEKLGYRQDLSDMLWLMTFSQSASYIGSQLLANWVVGHNMKEIIASPHIVVVIFALVGIIFTAKGWTVAQSSQTVGLKDYIMAFTVHIFGDRRVWLLMCAQACLHISIAFFWILWAPTLVADGRELQLGLIYPCFLGATMLGSTAFPWLINGPSPVQTENYLAYAFTVMGLVLSVTAYDYQEIKVLLMLFCLFHACAGLISPSLARLRSIYVPNELRGGMMSLSQAPANVLTFFFLLQAGYYRNLGNAALLSLAAMGLFAAAGCMHLLKQRAKQPFQDTHML